MYTNYYECLFAKVVCILTSVNLFVQVVCLFAEVVCILSVSGSC